VVVEVQDDVLAVLLPNRDAWYKVLPSSERARKRRPGGTTSAVPGAPAAADGSGTPRTLVPSWERHQGRMTPGAGSPDRRNVQQLRERLRGPDVDGHVAFLTVSESKTTRRIASLRRPSLPERVT
jgi:hypothetical protein